LSLLCFLMLRHPVEVRQCAGDERLQRSGPTRSIPGRLLETP